MACKPERCEKCGCKRREGTEMENEFPVIDQEAAQPQTVVQHHYHREPEGGGFWKYALGFGLGWLFFGC